MTRTIALRVAAGLAALLIVLWLVNALTGGKVAQVVARLQTNLAGAAIESGGDAVQTVGSQAASEDRTDTITKENDHAIRSAEGAAAPVAAAADRAGRASLCRRAAYRLDPACVQFTPAR